MTTKNYPLAPSQASNLLHLTSQYKPIPGTTNTYDVGNGVHLSFDYNPQEIGKELSVAIVRKPMFVPEGMIWAKVEGTLKQYEG